MKRPQPTYEVARRIHATSRAIERLRWSARAVGIRYLADTGRLACGHDLKALSDFCSVDLFRAEDARALQANRKISAIAGEPTRYWALPTCPECAVMVDQALEKPFVIHANFAVPGRKRTSKATCGAALEKGVPVFNALDLHDAQNSADGALWLPTCPQCRKAVEEELWGTFAGFLREKATGQ